MWSSTSSSSSDEWGMYQPRRLELALFHSTNYWGAAPIESSVAADEFNVHEPCVWLQARPHGLGPCCHGRGSRTVEFTWQSFQQEGGGADQDEWVLYLVRSAPGVNQHHYFYKFCLCPRGREPALRKPDGWRVVQGRNGMGSFCIGEYNELEGLEERINEYMNDEGTDCDGVWIHCHIGVICESLLQR